MQKTVVLTGAGGFLAGHFAGSFAAGGWRTVGVGRSDPHGQARRFDAFHLNDLSDPERMISMFDRDNPDVVVHLAAPSSVPLSVQHPLADFRGHAAPTANLLEAIRLSGRRPRIVIVSSAAVYGNPQQLPVPETAPLRPISPYGFHKLHQELLADEYATVHGLHCVKVRIFSTYGENLRRLAVWEITRRALSGDVSVYGSGDETRDYLYAGDAAEAVVRIAERAEFGREAINIGSGQSVSIRELVAEIFRLAGVLSPPRFTGEQLPGAPMRWQAGITRLRALGWTPPEWSRGLARTIEWIKGTG